MKKRMIFPAIGVLGLLAGCQSGGTNSSPRAAADPRGTAGTAATASETSAAGESAARLFVRGMSCPLCANNIDQQLLDVPGVKRVSVDLGSGEVRAAFEPGKRPAEAELARAIERSGFTLDRIEMPAN